MEHTPYLLGIESLMKIADIKISRTAVLSTLKMRLWKLPFKDYQLEAWYEELDTRLEDKEVTHALG
jgi:Arc/MetJ family transcription regulator